MTLPELTERVPLTRPDGRLDRRAVGWARGPLVDTDGVGRDGRRFLGRNKRWEYWGVVTPTHLIGVTVSAIDYAAVHEVWVLDRASEETFGAAATVVPARGVTLPGTLGGGPVRARAKGLDVALDEVPGGTRLRARTADAELDVVAELPAGHERLAVVVPWSDTRFQYTVKDVARPARGTVTTVGVVHELGAGESWAVLDHGRGRWPYDVRWNWGAGSGRSGGRVVGLQVGGRWTVGTGSTENAVVVDGRLTYLPAELTWDYDLAAPRRPWRVTGGGLDATFTPFYDKLSRTNLGVVASATHQSFGRWSGSFVPPAGGERVELDGLVGWAEEVHNRW